MKNFVYIFWLVIASVTAYTSTVQAQNPFLIPPLFHYLAMMMSFLPVDEAFEFNFHQKSDKLTVSFNIAEGYYLYRHQFKFTTEMHKSFQ